MFYTYIYKSGREDLIDMNKLAHARITAEFISLNLIKQKQNKLNRTFSSKHLLLFKAT